MPNKTRKKKVSALDSGVVLTARDAIGNDIYAQYVGPQAGGYFITWHQGAMPAHIKHWCNTLDAAEKVMKAATGDLRVWKQVRYDE